MVICLMVNSSWVNIKNDSAGNVLRWVLSIVVLVSSVFATDQRNYMDEADGGVINSAVSCIVWRSKPVIKIYARNHQEEINLTGVHSRLKKLTMQDRQELELEKYASVLSKNPETRRNGNCACACLSIVYADGSTYNVPTSEADQGNLITVVPKINQTALPKEFSLNGFTTIKAKKNACGTGTRSSYICITSQPSVKEARSLIEKRDAYSYLCAETQIIGNLFFSDNYAAFKEFIKKSVHQNQAKPISLIVLNIYSELDSCGWCGPMLVKLTESVNRGKPWMFPIEEYLKMKKTELEREQRGYVAQSKQLESESEGRDLLTCSDEYLGKIIATWQEKENGSKFPSPLKIDPEEFKKARDLYKSAKSRSEQLEKDYEESKSAMFLVVVSSSQEGHRSREIGLDPVFMDKELCDYPIVIKLPGQDISKLESYLSLPPNFVVFTPASDVQGFPLLRLSIPGLSLSKLLEDTQ